MSAVLEMWHVLSLTRSSMQCQNIQILCRLSNAGSCDNECPYSGLIWKQQCYIAYWMLYQHKNIND